MIDCGQRSLYDADNRPIWTDDTNVDGTLPDGSLPDGTHTTYDPLGNVVETDRYHDVVISVTTVNGVSTSQLVSSDPTPFSTTSTVYNAAEQVTSETDAAGRTTTYQLNADGQTTQATDPLLELTKSGYNAAGQVVSETNALNDTTHMYYDGAGDLVKTLYPDGTTTSAMYDANGRKISETDQMGQTTRYQYDGQGNLTAVTQPAVVNPVTHQMQNPVTSYLYDAYGDMTQVTDANGNGHVTKYTFDQFGHQLSRELPMTQTETLTYDPDGRLSTSVDFDGQKTVYHYNDALGVVDTKTYYAAGSTTQGETIAYHFDALGRNDVVTDTQGTNQRVTLYGYNSENRLTSITSPEGWLQYGYDPATGEHTSTTTQNTDTRYGYDALGRLWTVTVDMLNGASLAAPLLTTYHYTALGNVSEIDYPNGAQTNYSYDVATGTHLLNVVNKEGSTLLSSYTYTVNANGLWKSDSELEQESNGSYSSRLFTWTYDALNRLTQESLNSSIAGESYTTSYTLDLVGNRIGETTTNAAGTLAVTDTYNANDELTQETGTLNGTANYQTNYGYDANGSETSVTRTGTNPETDTYGSDLRGDLATASISRQENGHSVIITAAYTYDEQGNRAVANTSITVDTGTAVTQVAQYLLDPENPTGFIQVLEEHLNGAGSPAVAYMVGARILGQSDSSGTLYLLTDGHGNTRVTVDGMSRVDGRYAYDAFGNVLGQSIGVTNPPDTSILYSGQYYDVDLSQYYLRARYYQPTTDRFTTMDSFEGFRSEPLSRNEYVYANANPISGFDPTGHYDAGIDALVIGALLTTVMAFSGDGANGAGGASPAFTLGARCKLQGDFLGGYTANDYLKDRTWQAIQNPGKAGLEITAGGRSYFKVQIWTPYTGAHDVSVKQTVTLVNANQALLDSMTKYRATFNLPPVTNNQTWDEPFLQQNPQKWVPRYTPTQVTFADVPGNYDWGSKGDMRFQTTFISPNARLKNRKSGIEWTLHIDIGANPPLSVTQGQQTLE